ncbi:MAG: SEC-C domain-containing protein [Nocardioidaceae bacterium]
MTWEDPLRADGFGPVGPGESNADDPTRLAGELVSSVDWSRVANPAHSDYVARLATQVTESPGDEPGASTLLDRAVDGGEDDGPREADRARKLFAQGREDEAMTVLHELRPRLTYDTSAAYYLTDVLVSVERAEEAMRWLTGALTRVFDFGSDNVDDAELELSAVLLVRRYELRRELDLPFDDYDDYAAELTADDEDDPFFDDDLLEEAPVLAFWPRDEFRSLRDSWPELATAERDNWDEHRGIVERRLVTLSESGHTGIGVVAGSVEGLVAMAEFMGLPAASGEVLADYRDELAELGESGAWPPGRNAPCWCGSGAKYKTCCRPRSRDAA